MHVSVNGVRLFFDVEGAKFVPERVTAVIPDFIARSKIKPAPEGAGFEILHWRTGTPRNWRSAP